MMARGPLLFDGYTLVRCDQIIAVTTSMLRSSLMRAREKSFSNSFQIEGNMIVVIDSF